MITLTSLTNKATLAKIRKAYKESKETGLPVYVVNRKGLPFLRVAAGKQGNFVMYGTGNKDLTALFWKAQSRALLIKGK